MLQLEDRAPGHSVVQHVFRLQRTVRPRARWQRVLGVSPLHPEARPWYIGAVGEIEVGRLLARLPEEWRVLHSVPLSTSGTDVDHIVVGPGGVFTINTKHHRGAKVWVGGGTLLVNGQKKDYIVKAEAEAKRVQQRLKQIAGVRVQPVITLLGLKELTVRKSPRIVTVRRAERLATWLVRRPAVLSQEQRALALRSLLTADAWAEHADEEVVDATWFRGLQREVETARVRRVGFTFVGLVLAAPVFLFLVEHLVSPLVGAFFGLMLPHS